MFQRALLLYPTLDQIAGLFPNKFGSRKTADGCRNLGCVYRNRLLQRRYFSSEKFYKSNPPWNYNVVDMESRFEFEIDDPKTGEKHAISE